MRGEYQIPTSDWDSHDSLADVTEIYIRAEDLQSAPFIPLPPNPGPPDVGPLPLPLPVGRFEMPSLPAFATGSSPNVRVSSRIGAPDATHRVPRQSAVRVPVLAIGVVGAMVLGVSIGIVVAFGSGSAAVAKPAAPSVHTSLTVTPIIVPAVHVTPIVVP